MRQSGREWFCANLTEMRQNNLNRNGRGISFAGVTMSAGEAVVSSSQQRHSHQQREAWVVESNRCEVESADRKSVGMQQRRLLLSDAMRAAVVDPSTCFVVDVPLNTVHRSGPMTPVHKLRKPVCFTVTSAHPNRTKTCHEP